MKNQRRTISFLTQNAKVFFQEGVLVGPHLYKIQHDNQVNSKEGEVILHKEGKSGQLCGGPFLKGRGIRPALLASFPLNEYIWGLLSFLGMLVVYFISYE